MYRLCLKRSPALLSGMNLESIGRYNNEDGRRSLIVNRGGGMVIRKSAFRRGKLAVICFGLLLTANFP